MSTARRRNRNPSARRECGHGLDLNSELGLRPWTQVAEEWKRRSGETLTPYWCNQICLKAERKIAQALAGSV